MDANREIEEAAQGHAEAEDAWNLFHSTCRDVMDSIQGNGLVIDIHGQV